MKTKNTLIAVSILLIASGCSGESAGPPPFASFEASCVEFVCEFNASASQSRTSGGLNYFWNFGDQKSNWGGASTSHAYAASGNLEVVLTVQDAYGQTASATKSINVTGNPAADYYYTVHDAISLMLMADDHAHALASIGDGLQDAAEGLGVPGSQGYALQCASGTANVQSWTDANNDLSINGTETLTLTAEKCQISAGAEKFTSADGIKLTGDFDSDTFALAPAATAVKAFQIGSYSKWFLRANMNFTRTVNGSTTSLDYVADDAILAFTSSDGRILLSIRSDIDANSGTQRYSNMQGSYSFDYSSGSYTLNFETPATFASSGDTLKMTAGKVKLVRGTTAIFISPDADPAYLKIEVDKQSNATIDIETRFPQSVAVERLIN